MNKISTLIFWLTLVLTLYIPIVGQTLLRRPLIDFLLSLGFGAACTALLWQVRQTAEGTFLSHVALVWLSGPFTILMMISIATGITNIFHKNTSAVAR